MAAEVNKADLQRLADEKLADAQSLLNDGRWSNAYYLGGYAVEMAIKACIAKSFKVETIPDKDLVLDTYTHKFPKLVGTAGLAADLRNKEQADQAFAANWGVANEWTPDSRYQTTSEQDATELLEAIGEPNHGVSGVDKNSLVEVGRKIVKGLQNGGVPLVAALWVREAMDEQWLLWISPKSFTGRTNFYASLANVLTKLRAQTGYFEISNVRAIEPTNSIVYDLKRFGKVSPDRPMYLQSVSLSGVYLKEGVLLYVE